ncbi:MAG: biopolymer transporter ExbD [Acidobacteria bacterium]|uniref:Biopolymer transporter ExbD n=1 Tax=Candidatus Polarisedimenticola svalbardensis TaxID=2886004 RepID=A0A8J6XRB4_9BACT|nr:biopolymer transporter ExbD [Candidatus Polarisedimenticola svalbardensis]
MHFRRGSKLRVAIDIAPLVDVVFLLVIFFAVSTTFQDSAGLKLQLPTSNAAVDREPREITVVLDREGRLEFDGRLLAEDRLEGELKAALAGRENPLVVLRADKDASHGDVVRIMGLIRQAGAEGLTIAARSGAE